MLYLYSGPRSGHEPLALSCDMATDYSAVCLALALKTGSVHPGTGSTALSADHISGFGSERAPGAPTRLFWRSSGLRAAVGRYSGARTQDSGTRTARSDSDCDGDDGRSDDGAGTTIPAVVSGLSEQGRNQQRSRGGRLRKRKDGKTYVRRAKRRRVGHELPGEGQQRRGGGVGVGRRLVGDGKRGWVT